MPSKKTRILVCGSTQGVYGGIEVFMTALAEYLHTTTEFAPELLFKLTQGAELQTSLVELTERLPFKVSVTQRGMRELMPHFRDIDLIHTQNLPPDVVTAAKFLGKPVVATIHNWRRPTRSAHNLLWRLNHELVDARTYNSDFVRKSWTKQPDSIRSQVIPTVSRLQSSAAPWEGRSGFLFVGRWIENKGLDDLVNAYARSGLDNPKSPLILLGDGPLREDIETLIQELGLQSVRICGQVSDTEKFRLLSSARWLVAPPRTREDLGLTPIEARSLRIPVIASKDGGLPEAAGEQALYFTPGNIDELAETLQIAEQMDEAEYRQRASDGFDSLQTFLRPLSEYTSIYSEVLSS